MTAPQKKILECLIMGGHVVKVIAGKYTARDHKGNPIARGGDRTMYQVFKYCRKVKKIGSVIWILDKRKVLSLSGNSWIKKNYKAVRYFQKKIDQAHAQADGCFPCKMQITTSTYKLSL